jgi:hypothetical protein
MIRHRRCASTAATLALLAALAGAPAEAATCRSTANHGESVFSRAWSWITWIVAGTEDNGGIVQ